MIEFEVLVMKVKTNDTYTIFLLKENVRYDTIKMILGYSLIAILTSLEEWKTAITLGG